MELALRGVVIVGVLVWIWALVDIARKPAARWPGGGEEKTAWLLGVVVTSGIGGFVYWIYGRNRTSEGRDR